MNDLLFAKWMDVLPELLNHPDGCSTSKINRKLGMTYAHISSAILPLFIKKGLLIKNFNGRTNNLLLTEKGVRVAKYILLIKTELRGK